MRMCKLSWFKMVDNPKRTSQPPKRLLKDYLAVEYKKKKTNESVWDNKLYEIDKKVKFDEHIALFKQILRHKG